MAPLTAVLLIAAWSAATLAAIVIFDRRVCRRIDAEQAEFND